MRSTLSELVSHLDKVSSPSSEVEIKRLPGSSAQPDSRILKLAEELKRGAPEHPYIVEDHQAWIIAIHQLFPSDVVSLKSSVIWSNISGYGKGIGVFIAKP